MLTRFSTLIRRWLGKPTASDTTPASDPGVMGSVTTREEPEQDRISDASHLVPYDENLLERARTQWQFGDWQSLAQLNRDTLQHHPDRAKLALLAAAGRLQLNKIDEAKHYIRLANDWGVNKKLLTRILAAGVHNSLGRAAAVGNQQPRAVKHFYKAVSVGSPESDLELLAMARMQYQDQQINSSAVIMKPLSGH